MSKHKRHTLLTILFYYKRAPRLPKVYMFFMSSCQKKRLHVLPCKYRTKSKNMLQNKNQFWRIKKLFLWYYVVQTAPMLNDSATFTVQ